MSEALRHLREVSDRVLGIYQELYHETARFSGLTGIKCREGCGACCYNPDKITATMLELLPMAFEIYDHGLLEDSLSRLYASRADAVCFAYEFDPGHTYSGACGFYDFRPPVCALFGSSTRSLKHDDRSFLGCSWQKANFAGEIAAIEGSVEMEESRSSMIARAVLLQFPDLSLLSERPINEALISALERIAMFSDYADITPLSQCFEKLEF